MQCQVWLAGGSLRRFSIQNHYFGVIRKALLLKGSQDWWGWLATNSVVDGGFTSEQLLVFGPRCPFNRFLRWWVLESGSYCWSYSHWGLRSLYHSGEESVWRLQLSGRIWCFIPTLNFLTSFFNCLTNVRLQFSLTSVVFLSLWNNSFKRYLVLSQLYSHLVLPSLFLLA